MMVWEMFYLIKQLKFSTNERVSSSRLKIIQNIDKANSMIQETLCNTKGINFIKQIKFQKCSVDTLFEYPTNFIEQINQTTTYLVCLAAVDLLLSKFPQHSFYVNFGTKAGYDVESEDSSIICECFAVTTPDSNSKLKKDTEKIHNNNIATNKYVVFYASTQKLAYIAKIKNNYPEIEIIALNNI